MTKDEFVSLWKAEMGAALCQLQKLARAALPKDHSEDARQMVPNASAAALTDLRGILVRRHGEDARVNALKMLDKIIAAQPASPADPSGDSADMVAIPPIMYNGDTKRDPALRLCIKRWSEDQNKQVDAAVDSVFDRPEDAHASRQDGCTRSHPHENMSAECKAKTIAAMLAAAEAPAEPTLSGLVPCIEQCGNAVTANGDHICFECREESIPAPVVQAKEVLEAFTHWWATMTASQYSMMTAKQLAEAAWREAAWQFRKQSVAESPKAEGEKDA